MQTKSMRSQVRHNGFHEMKLVATRQSISACPAGFNLWLKRLICVDTRLDPEALEALV